MVSSKSERSHLRLELDRDGEHWSVKQVIIFDDPIDDFEIRLGVDKKSEMSLESLELKPIPSRLDALETVDDVAESVL